MERKRLVFTGQVQGVGFRMTTRRVATGFEVSGFVRNLDDGGVELVVEGPSAAVADFVAAVRRKFADNIEGVEEGPGLPAAGGFSGFTIRH